MKEVITEKGRWGDNWLTLLVKDDMVGVKESQLVRGTNRYSGKTYARFKDTSNVFYSWRNGRLRVYSKNGKAIRDVTHLYAVRGLVSLRQEGDLRDRGFEMALGKTYAEAVDEHYPLLGYFRGAPGIMAYLAQPNVQEFTREFFGKSNYRKDLVRRVAGLSENLRAESASTVLLTAKSLNNLVPIDWLIAWMETGDKDRGLSFGRLPFWTDPNPRKGRAMFRTADQKQLRRLLKDQKPALTGLNDSANDFHRLRDADPGYRLSALQFGTFRELHDVLARDATRIQYPRKEISYKGKGGKLPGDYGDIKIVAPQDTHDLLDWGTYMSNCISGYGNRAAEGSTLLYAVMEGDRMVANMELDPRTGDIRQLLGKYNDHVPREIADATKDAIRLVWPNANTEGGWQ